MAAPQVHILDWTPGRQVRSGGSFWPTKAGEMCHLQACTDTADNWEECQQASVLASPAFPTLVPKDTGSVRHLSSNKFRNYLLTSCLEGNTF